MNRRHRSHPFLLLAVPLALLSLLIAGGSVAASEDATSTIGPGMVGPDGVVPEIWAEYKTKTAAGDEDIYGQQDASGCNGDVCIWLTGSGLQIDNWETRGYPDPYRCSYAELWRNGQVIATSNTVCGESGVVFYSSYGSSRFADGTQLCNTWTNLPGRPCKTIYD